jgi:hypothetical protein
MSGIEPTATEQSIIDAGFVGGWVLQGDELILWEHTENPPAPLTRPA